MQQIIEDIKKAMSEINFGEVRIIIQNGTPVRIEQTKSKKIEDKK